MTCWSVRQRYEADAPNANGLPDTSRLRTKASGNELLHVMLYRWYLHSSLDTWKHRGRYSTRLRCTGKVRARDQGTIVHIKSWRLERYSPAGPPADNSYPGNTLDRPYLVLITGWRWTRTLMTKLICHVDYTCMPVRVSYYRYSKVAVLFQEQRVRRRREPRSTTELLAVP